MALQDWGADEATITGAFTEEGQPRGLRGLPETIALPSSSTLRPSLVSDDTQCTVYPFAAACAEHVRVESRLAAVSVTPVYNIGG